MLQPNCCPYRPGSVFPNSDLDEHDRSPVSAAAFQIHVDAQHARLHRGSDSASNFGGGSVSFRKQCSQTSSSRRNQRLHEQLRTTRDAANLEKADKEEKLGKLRE